MKKIILFITIVIFNFLIPSIVRGQGINEKVASFSGSIPALSCGVAGDTTGRDKCCYLSPPVKCESPVLNTVSSFLNLIPGTDGFVSGYIEGCNKINDYAGQLNNSPCLVGNPSTTDFSNPSCKCVDTTIVTPNQAITDMCAKYLSANIKEVTSCVQCAAGNGMWTGMGCLPLDLNTLIGGFILNTGIGIGGMFAFLCIIYAAFMMQSSQGNPEKLKKAQEMITSCIMGLMLIIFSVFIMRLIGVNILRIPGFS
jgi:hypothetical protein